MFLVEKALIRVGVIQLKLQCFLLSFQHVEPLPFAKEVVSFPVPCQNDLKFPNPDSKEVQQRKVFEFVPEHLPYMHPELNGNLSFVYFPLPKALGIVLVLYISPSVWVILSVRRS